MPSKPLEVYMEHVKECGTGNSYVQVAQSEMLRLENVPLSMEMATLFLHWQKISLTLEFSQRDTKSRWGTAWPKKRKVVLYRHSVWTFLHEVAHVVAGHHGHVGVFPVALRGLYLAWRELES